MRPEGRTQAAIEILDLVIEAARDQGPSADVIIADYFRARRYAGSKDRRAVREIVYDCIRVLGERPASGRAAILGARPDLTDHFTGVGVAPATLSPEDEPAAPGLAPAWIVERLGDAADPSLLSRAPIDLRVNALKACREELMGLGTPIHDLPYGLTGAPEDIAQRAEYRGGLVEIQDSGSQRITQMAAARPGMTVIDLCAGAGGKTLALAADMRNEGLLIASDSDRRRLGNVVPRAERAGASIIETRLLDPGEETGALADLTGRADLVLVDAPCSGTGTWRRNPEARWRLTPDRLSRLVSLQERLLAVAASLVRPGGALVYAVCSLLPEEGEAQLRRFSENGFLLAEKKTLHPRTDGCDGFFIARFEKAC
ncbi:RNA methyltransferase [Pacificimonas flava]|uniref:RNA methyltransferase n=2 Tax=Pacificimonas TaxID=1960290 RepID=A0A219B719_9SPHN|nr:MULTISPECIES: RsmB/NOP family class I SAM-dependent RNA methyltransferase [Pacificimonas]MBZ6378560.1 RsmB/NOP family class I SAM-dependent RNA methyltransferase [Pacificimonas aurantium]OWV34157.1 RNA methyltransferase [Pacificimonas flava]